MTARLEAGAYVLLAAGVTVTEGLEDVLCRVVRVEGELRDIRRVSQVSGEPEGLEARFLAAELRPASPAALRWHEALRVRSALAGWRQAVADDDEDVDSLAILVETAEQLADRVINADPTHLDELAVCGYVSDHDGAQVVEIDTTEAARRVRVLIGDGVIYDGDPNTDQPPGEHCAARGWPASVASCDECGAQTTELVSEQHEQSYSLYPPTAPTVVPSRSASRPGSIDDVADRIDPKKARYAVARMCVALGRKLDWGAGMFNDLLDAIVPAAPDNCPPFFCQDDDDVAFWQSATAIGQVQ
ncbi:hypothetical protein [Mycobacterium intracellulare]|uniref:hypothetical protein n=1 Tax=Mycobacterium intracellulare TaxID=1767 RepID=UPI001EEE9AFC|nr:hypothetical protein [Mycobacterium intracellulare]MEE3755382.1 hypothetical protein [Mycobacterium intracellulare]